MDRDSESQHRTGAPGSQPRAPHLLCGAHGSFLANQLPQDSHWRDEPSGLCLEGAGGIMSTSPEKPGPTLGKYFPNTLPPGAPSASHRVQQSNQLASHAQLVAVSWARAWGWGQGWHHLHSPFGLRWGGGVELVGASAPQKNSTSMWRTAMGGPRLGVGRPRAAPSQSWIRRPGMGLLPRVPSAEVPVGPSAMARARESLGPAAAASVVPAPPSSRNSTGFPQGVPLPTLSSEPQTQEQARDLA